MCRLANEEKLEARFRDHKLGGPWKDFRGCHIEPDWLLIYRTEGSEITFVRTGTHSDLLTSSARASLALLGHDGEQRFRIGPLVTVSSVLMSS